MRSGGDLPVGDLALGEVRILQAQHRLQIGQRKSVVGELRGIGIHAHRRQRSAPDGDGSDALNLRQFLLDDRGRFVVHPAGIVFVRRQRQNHDRRIGRIYLAVRRIRGQVGRQVGSRRVNGGLNVARRAVNIAAEVKLNGDRSGAQRTRRGHFRDPGDMAELPFQRSGHGGSHDLPRSRLRQTGGHRNGRKIHRRAARRHGQHLIRNRTGEGHRDGEQRGGYRPTDEWFGNAHARPGASAGPVSGSSDLCAKRCAILSKKM